MRTSFFPNCCGINIVSRFGHTTMADYPFEEPSDEEIEAYLKIAEAEAMNAETPIIIAAINDEQHKKFGHIFPKLGWQLLIHEAHKAHGTVVYLYSKSIK